MDKVVIMHSFVHLHIRNQLPKRN